MAKKITKATKAVEAAPMAVTPLVPIWRDFTYQFLSTSPEDYALRINGEVAYIGHAVPKPNDFTKVKLNNIVGNYLHQQFPNVPQSDKYAVALVEIDEGNTGAFKEVARFCYDWSYEGSFDPEGGLLSCPVQRTLSPNQKFYFTMRNAGAFEYTTTDKEGNVQTYSAQGAPDAYRTYSIDNLTGLSKVTIGSMDFRVTDGCEEFCLYYVNAHGGWDSLLIPRGVRSSSITRHVFRQEYDNRVEVNAGKVDYLNDMARRYELHTALMGGDDGKRMHHLVESPLVYLHDLKDGTLHPVIVTDTSLTEKTYRSEGGNLYQYAINVEVARDFKRR